MPYHTISLLRRNLWHLSRDFLGALCRGEWIDVFAENFLKVLLGHDGHTVGREARACQAP